MLQVLLLALAAGVVFSGCSKLAPQLDKVVPDNRVEYRKSKNMPDLEVPPDLTTDAIKDRMAIPQGGDTATYSTYQERVAKRKREEELERSANEAVRVLDNEHVLAVPGAVTQVWPKLTKIVADLGYALELNDEELGIIETAWVENQEELHREKYKIFAEPGQEAGTSVLYISNRSEELVAKGGDMVWQPAARNVEHEASFVAKVQGELGVGGSTPQIAGAAPVPAPARAPASSATAETDAASPAATEAARTADQDLEAGTTGAMRAELISAGGGKIYLSVLEDFSAAWRSTGVALQRAGYDVDQSDKQRGIYYIRVPVREGEVKKRGMFSKLKFWGNDDEAELQLNLTGVGEKTEVVVLDKEGRWETGAISKRILDRLNRELNRMDS
jgi:outer membrane protein assembly factor BamC